MGNLSSINVTLIPLYVAKDIVLFPIFPQGMLYRESFKYSSSLNPESLRCMRG